MRDVTFSPSCHKKLQILRKTDRQLFQKVQKKLLLFKENPKYTSLRLHKLKGNLQNVWSVSIDKNYRMLYVDDEISIYFIDLGTHDEVYKK